LDFIGTNFYPRWLVMVDHKEPMSILMDQPVMLLLVLTLWLGLEGMLLA
jgi:phosphate starvation-inducible membrane PsiE